MLKIDLVKDSSIPLYTQIRDNLKKTITEKKVAAGEKLPTVVELSRQLNVTQATVIRAYEDLIRENLIVSHVGRGTFVNDIENMEAINLLKANSRSTRALFEPADPEFALAARRLRMGITQSLDALMVLLKRPGLINFTSGIPDPSIADPDILQKCTGKALKKGLALYQGYSHPLGLIQLRKAIAQRFKNNGTDITSDHVLITSGSQQAAAILAQVALENRYRIICETPCYMGIPNAFGAIGHWVESLPRDEKGPIPRKFAKYHDGRPSMLYLCSLLHNPMGTDISTDRIKIIKEWAQEQKSIIISDEIFHDLHCADKQPKSFFESFGHENTVVIGSISKSFMCGLRIGWLITSPEKIRSFMGLKRAMDIGTASLTQGIALALFESGQYDDHIKRAKEHYKIRRDAAVEALKKNMPEGVNWTNPQGGMHMWIELPQGYSSLALFLLAIENGVGLVPGPQMDIDHRFLNGFKLSYGSLTIQQIQEGLELLSAAVKKLLKNPPADPGLSGLGDFL